MDAEGRPAMMVRKLDFAYDDPYGRRPKQALTGVGFELGQGSRCLLIGANGAGKSTLLSILAGKHLHEKDAVVVLGHPAFYQTLGRSGVAFLGGGWTRTIAFAGNSVPYQADIRVADMMRQDQEEFPGRRERLYGLLEIDPEWRMHQVSDGQRRRVQIMLGLLRPFKVLLLDEMTVDLDVLARRDFLEYLKRECDERRATVVYATHIFDGMEGWPTDIVLLEGGKMVRKCSYRDVVREPGFVSLYTFVVDFLCDMRKKRPGRLAADSDSDSASDDVEPFATPPNCGYTPGRMMSYFK